MQTGGIKDIDLLVACLTLQLKDQSPHLPHADIKVVPPMVPILGNHTINIRLGKQSLVQDGINTREQGEAVEGKWNVNATSYLAILRQTDPMLVQRARNEIELNKTR